MQAGARVVSLSDRKSWTTRDTRAIELLFNGDAPLNSAGLHHDHGHRVPRSKKPRRLLAKARFSAFEAE
jgi:hypothetical protein